MKKRWEKKLYLWYEQMKRLVQQEHNLTPDTLSDMTE